MSHFKIHDLEIFELLKKGLQPYEKSQAPFQCPDYCHEYHYHWDRTSIISDKEEQKKIRERLISITDDDPDAVSWKYYRQPDSNEKFYEILDEIKETYYKKIDVEEFNRKFNIINEYSRDLVKESKQTLDSGKICLLSGYSHIKALIKTTNEQEIFKFNENQAKIVEALHSADQHMLYVKKIREVSGTITSHGYQVRQSFQHHPNWKKLIVPVKDNKGYWRLNI